MAAFIVCQSAQSAVEACLALAQKQQEKGNNKKDETKQTDNSKQRYQHASRSRDRRQGTSMQPWTKRRRVPVPSRNQTFQGRNRYQEPTKRRNQFIAPIINSIMIIGDSIALRMAKQQKVFAPKYMNLCYGGATFQSLLEAAKAVNSVHKSVCLIAGMSNALKVDTTIITDKSIPVNLFVFTIIYETQKTKLILFSCN